MIEEIKQLCELAGQRAKCKVTMHEYLNESKVLLKAAGFNEAQITYFIMLYVTENKEWFEQNPYPVLPL